VECEIAGRWPFDLVICGNSKRITNESAIAGFTESEKKGGGLVGGEFAK
jgi:hypothetical protein